MATRKHMPTVRLRRLAAELRRMRAASELSQEDVSENTGINKATLYRIETAKTRPQKRTLIALLNLYGADSDQREHLLALSRDAGKQGWLRPYHEDLPEEYTAYISFEQDAEGVRNYESLFIPGLLQTEDYARAVIAGVLPTASQQEVDDRVQARMERQQVLEKNDPLKLWAIVDESALHKLVGGSKVMAAQLEHLVQAAKTPHVTLQVIPNSAGAHAGMPGAFVVMDFSDPLDTDLIYIDNMAGDLFLEAEAEVKRYNDMFNSLRAVALSPGDSVALLKTISKNT